MVQEPLTTENQLKFESAFRFALQQKCVVAVLDFPGTGFKHALRRFCFYNSDVRTAYVEIPAKSKTKELTIKMLTQLMTIRFSNFKYTQPSVFDLILILGTRVKQDLKGKRILIVFEGVHHLTESRLVDFMRVIKGINFPCGVVLRLSQDYLFKTVPKMKEEIHNDFKLLTKWRKVAQRNKRDDVATLCRLHGVDQPSVINQICNETSFTMAMELIDGYKRYSPTTQLNLFGENRLRM
jgi:hypothetical protein